MHGTCIQFVLQFLCHFGQSTSQWVVDKAILKQVMLDDDMFIIGVLDKDDRCLSLFVWTCLKGIQTGTRYIPHAAWWTRGSWRRFEPPVMLPDQASRWASLSSLFVGLLVAVMMVVVVVVVVVFGGGRFCCSSSPCCCSLLHLVVVLLRSSWFFFYGCSCCACFCCVCFGRAEVLMRKHTAWDIFGACAWPLTVDKFCFCHCTLVLWPPCVMAFWDNIFHASFIWTVQKCPFFFGDLTWPVWSQHLGCLVLSPLVTLWSSTSLLRLAHSIPLPFFAVKWMLSDAQTACLTTPAFKSCHVLYCILQSDARNLPGSWRLWSCATPDSLVGCCRLLPSPNEKC